MLTDVVRLAEQYGVPMGFSDPDPVMQDLEARTVGADQPHIGRLSRLGVLATEEGDGLSYIAAASRRIWCGTNAGDAGRWTEPSALDEAALAAGLSPQALETQATEEANRLDAASGAQ